MPLMRLPLMLCLLLLLWLQPLSVQAQDLPGCPDRIRLVYFDGAAEPFLLGEGRAIPEPPGLLVEWVRKTLDKLGCLPRASFERLPVGRIAALVSDEIQGFDLLLGLAQSSPYVQQMRVPAAPARPEQDLSVLNQDFYLYARADDPPPWDGVQLMLREGQTVGVASRTVGVSIAVARGWPVEPALSNELAVRMTLAGRTAAVLMASAFLDDRLARKDPRLQGLVKLQPAVASERFYVGATVHFYRRHRDFVHQFWVEVCRQGNALRAKPLSCPLSALKGG